MERFWLREGKWFKGNLHTHTTNSDGTLSPQEAINRYRQNGYDFLALSDHHKLTRVASEPGDPLLLIPSEEISVGKPERGGEFHVLAVNIHEQIEHGQFDHPQAVIDAVRGQGGEAIIAHPYWSNLCIRDLEPLTGYLGVEIYNSLCQIGVGRGHSLVHWDDLLIRKRPAFGFAHDDSHNNLNDHRPSDAALASIMVKASTLTVEAIMAAIHAGEFYACSGPGKGPEIFDFYLEDGIAVARTSPAKVITVIANSDPAGGTGERFAALQSPTLTEARYKLRGKELCVRLEVVDTEGKTAWSNPIFLHE